MIVKETTQDAGGRLCVENKYQAAATQLTHVPNEEFIKTQHLWRRNHKEVIKKTWKG